MAVQDDGGAARPRVFFFCVALLATAAFTFAVIHSVATVAASNFNRIPGAAAEGDKSSDDSVGTIEGDAIALQGPMSVEVVHGQVKTMLRSGNDIRVKSGSARIDLVEGGKIAICGPAHLSVLKSRGSLTLALDTGIVRVHIDKNPAITIYTAQIQAKPISIGESAEDALIGFDAPGVMCVRATSGAIRLEQQLTGQNVIVPQGGDILLNNGALDGLANVGGHCECELPLAKGAPPPELSRIATPEEIRQRDAEKAAIAAAEKDAAERDASDKAAADKAAAEKATADKLAADQAAAERASREAAQKAAQQPPPPAPTATTTAKNSAPKAQEPIYQVFMPPLSFDAKASAQPENFDPKFIVLVRRVRVKPTLIFKGTVEGDATVAKQVSAVKPLAGTTKPGSAAAPGATPAPAPAKPAATPPQDDSVVKRVRNYIRHLFS
ncbi:MAG TPA: hypothetical protein VGG58_05870 [Candidatus Acidoferrum sp.]